MEGSFRSVIAQSQSLVIFLPKSPSFDEVASALSLFLGLKDSKPVQIVSASPVTVSLNRLIGVDRISGETGNKNLVIGFSGYDANNIEKVSYDIVEDQFKLTVLPKSGINPPKAEQVRITYEGVSADTVILFGGNTDADFPQLSVKGTESSKMYHIGTHPLTVDPSKVIYTFAQPLASVSELTFFLLSEAQIQVDSDIATNFLMGIEDATQNYKSGNISAETFEVTAALIRAGGRRLSGETVDRNKYPQGSIPQVIVKPEIPENQPVMQSVTATDYADFSQVQPEAPQEIQDAPIADDNAAKANEEILNPPDDWLQPKVYRGTSIN